MLNTAPSEINALSGLSVPFGSGRYRTGNIFRSPAFGDEHSRCVFDAALKFSHDMPAIEPGFDWREEFHKNPPGPF